MKVTHVPLKDFQPCTCFSDTSNNHFYNICLNKPLDKLKKANTTVSKQFLAVRGDSWEFMLLMG